MEDDVKAIILKSIEDYNYSEIILFGSRAKKKYSEDSDYDLLLIMNNPLSILEMRKMQVEIRKKLALQGIDADVIVKSRKIIDEYKTKKGNIIYNALREGVTLWVMRNIEIKETKEAIELMNKIISVIKETMKIV